jgi:acetate---CoA ligase (ADP-forming)
VMLKVGRSEMSAEVARAHTGAVVGDDRAFDAFCDRYAISRVDSIEEAVVTAALIERNGPLEKTGAALVSITGGGCAVFADLAEAVGLPVPQLAAETRAALKPVLPDFASTLNPLDVTGAVLQDFAVWEKTMPIVYNDPSIGIVLTLMSVPSFRYEVGATLGHWSAIAAGYRAAGKRAGRLDGDPADDRRYPRAHGRVGNRQYCVWPRGRGARARSSHALVPEARG